MAKSPANAGAALGETSRGDIKNPTSEIGLKHIALIGNFPPRRCGIATFTCDVYEALSAADPKLAIDVVAMTDRADGYDYPASVQSSIRQDVLADYRDAARRINRSGAEIVCLQHEYGIFGGRAGDYVLTLIHALNRPLVTTLHTVLANPNEDQRRVMAAIAQRSAKLVVMAQKGRELLRRVYDVPGSKIVVAPHGAPDYPFVSSEAFKRAFDLVDREVLLTFGLLGPGKGLEAMIRAMPAIVAARPKATYVILGATHPHLLAREGEAYRESLTQLASDLGVAENVRFVNAFVDTDQLLAHLSAADIYVTPYPNEAQITSGTLSYAVALGKAVISTPYWHARELLSEGRGVLTPFNDSAAMAEAAIALLSDASLHERIRTNAYAAGRETIWSRFAERYLDMFTAIRRGERTLAHATERTHRPLPAIALNAVERLSDGCGIAQHTLFGVPDRVHGYCLDDNARGLILTCDADGANAERLAWTYAAFVQHAWNEGAGAFRNFMSFDRRWLEESGSQDSFGRGFWCLGVTASRARRQALRTWANALAHCVLPHTKALQAPRAQAFAALGLCGMLDALSDDEAPRVRLREIGDELLSLLRANRRPDWTWFEPFLAYDNARLPEALLRAGRTLGDDRCIEAGLASLDWLCAVQSAPEGHFRPVGTENFGKPYTYSAAYDQQPLEAAATIDACAAAFEVTGDARWQREARRAFDWFMGANDLGQSLVDVEDGGCRDGLCAKEVNLNQGAESVLSFQMALCAMHKLTRAARAEQVRVSARRMAL